MSERTLSLWICYFLRSTFSLGASLEARSLKAKWARQYQLTLFEGLNVLFKDPFLIMGLFLLRNLLFLSTVCFILLKSNWTKTKQTPKTKPTCMWMSWSVYIFFSKKSKHFQKLEDGIELMEYIPLTHWHLCFCILNLCSICHSGLNHTTNKTLRFSLITLFLCKAKLTGSSCGESWLSLVTRSLSVPWQGHTSYTRGNFSQ